MMLNKAILVVIGLSLTACSRLFPETPPPPDPYAGRPVAYIALLFGPPTLQVDVGNDQRAFHWIHYNQAPPTGGFPAASGLPPVGVFRGPRQECRLWAVAHTLRPPEPGLSNWIVDDWRYYGAGCSRFELLDKRDSAYRLRSRLSK